jgi:hypothetical protein
MNYFNEPMKIRSYGQKQDTFSMLIKKFKNGVKDLLINIMQNDKKMSEDNANEFIYKMFTLDPRRTHDLDEFVLKCYTDGNNKKECANKLIDKYYKITKINFFKEPLNHEEITEVNEKINIDNSYNMTSIKLFWIFIEKIKNMDTKFNLDTIHIKNSSNSFSNEDFILLMKTKDIENILIESEFKHSNILSKFVKFFTDKSNKTKFYIGIGKDNQLHYGYIVHNEMYQIGKCKYENTDIAKLDEMIIKVDNNINFKLLSLRFKSTINILNLIHETLKRYLSNYYDIYMYIDIIENKLSIIVDNEDKDILTKNYLINVINNNISYPKYINIDIKLIKDSKDIYIISIA